MSKVVLCSESLKNPINSHWHSLCLDKVYRAVPVTFALVMIGFIPRSAQAQTRVYTVPQNGLFYFARVRGTNGPPAPSCPFSPADVPVYLVGTNPDRYLIDDTQVEPPIDTTGGEGQNVPAGRSYGPDDFHIELSATNGFATPIVYGTESNYFYQVETNLDLAIWHHWTPGEILQNTDGTNAMYFSPVSTTTQPQEFFRAVKGITRAYIYAHSEAIEPNTSSTSDTGQTADFLVYLADSVPTNITLYYRISGSAQNGIDYTNLSGFLTITGGFSSGTITVQPLYDNLLEFDESVTLTLIPTNNYVVLPDQASATIYIEDNTNTPVNFDVVATGLNAPTGLGYDPLTNALITAVGSFGPGGYRFLRIGTNVPEGSTNLTITNWSTVTTSDVGVDEPYFSVVQTEGLLTNAAGFTNGDLFFNQGTSGYVGWINTNGSLANPFWAQVGVGGSFRGGLHMDRSGNWGGELVAVDDNGGIYRINSSGTNSLVTRVITTGSLEGAVTVISDVNRWGPLAGRLVTGDQFAHKIFAVDPRGYVLEFKLGIDPEDFDVIRENEDLYCTDVDAGQIPRLSRSYVTNFVGDLLVAQAGETAPACLFIVHWNGDDLVTTRIRYEPVASRHFEHVIFAPLNLPSLP
jgi:hypothetical protein